jgi:hypothetical protein
MGGKQKGQKEAKIDKKEIFAFFAPFCSFCFLFKN